MRYIVYGAGGIGGALGAGLHRSGRDTVLIARGEHRERMQRDGLVIETPDGRESFDVSVVGTPEEVPIRSGDVIVLAMKTQDTEQALRVLQGCAPSGVIIACAQNGVENERLALRRFAHVYGIMVRMPTTFLGPGVVQLNLSPTWGIMDVGSAVGAPVDDVADTMAQEFDAAGFSSRAVDDIMAWKYAKLLGNVPNAAFLACGSYDGLDDVASMAVDEATACFRAHGRSWIPKDRFDARRDGLPRSRPIKGQKRVGSSSHQSLIRGKGTIESDFINGEIVLLGRLLGVATPVNAVLQATANRLARDHAAPGAVRPDDLRRAIERRRARERP